MAFLTAHVLVCCPCPSAEYRLYRVGTWFTPCQWWEQDCRRNIYRERASGHLDMRWVGWRAGDWLRAWMAGMRATLFASGLLYWVQQLLPATAPALRAYLTCQPCLPAGCWWGCIAWWAAGSQVCLLLLQLTGWLCQEELNG